jgi:hypothetical protein
MTFACAILGLLAGCSGSAVLIYLLTMIDRPEDLGQIVSNGRSALGATGNVGRPPGAGQVGGSAARSTPDADRPLEALR